jgi:hypothetical protein
MFFAHTAHLRVQTNSAARATLFLSMRMRSPAPRFIYGCASVLALYGCGITQSRELAASKPAPPPIEFLGAWGKSGGDPADLGSPRAIATDSLGNVYVADAGAPTPYIHKYTHDGHPLLTFEPVIRMTNPCAMAVDQGGAIYVMECRTRALALFFPDNAKRRTIRAAIRLPHLAAPTGVTIADDGRIYIGQSHPTRIVRLAASGRLLGSIAGKKVESEIGEINQIAAGAHGDVFVADVQKHRVSRLSSTGALQNSWQWDSAVPDSTEWCALTANSHYVFLLAGSPSAPTLFVWSPDGSAKFSGPLPVDSALTASSDPSIFAATESNELLLLNAEGHQILRYKLNL